MTRWKTIPWVLIGVALLSVSLVAARLNSPGSPDDGVGSTPPPAGTVGGLTVVGTVGTTPDVLALSPPGVPGMASLTIKKVLVKEGSTVRPGDVLVEFDSSALVEKKEQAEQAVTEAMWVAEQARLKAELHARDVEQAKIGVKKAKEEHDTAKQARDTIKDALERALALKDLSTGQYLKEDEKELRRKENLDLQKAEAAVRLTKIGIEAAEAVQQKAEKSAPLLAADVQHANAAVMRLKSSVAEAAAVIEAFKLKAEVAGVIEQVSVSEGMAIGPTTRTPMMYLVPSGPRVVRAEIEAEFAHKIDGQVGKTVTIKAGEMFNDTYTGTARRMSGAFLPKRYGGDGLVSNPTRVLECVIDITDPTPDGRPPLRPGQPVRVVFGP